MNWNWKLTWPIFTSDHRHRQDSWERPCHCCEAECECDDSVHRHFQVLQDVYHFRRLLLLLPKKTIHRGSFHCHFLDHRRRRSSRSCRRWSTDWRETPATGAPGRTSRGGTPRGRRWSSRGPSGASSSWAAPSRAPRRCCWCRPLCGGGGGEGEGE